jgi:hypothetical protein
MQRADDPVPRAAINWLQTPLKPEKETTLLTPAPARKYASLEVKILMLLLKIRAV